MAATSMAHMHNPPADMRGRRMGGWVTGCTNTQSLEEDGLFLWMASNDWDTAICGGEERSVKGWMIRLGE